MSNSLDKIDEITFHIKEEFNSAVEKHGSMKGFHEAYGILLEEFDEFWDEVKKKPSKQNKENMKLELIQIAAMCCRTIVDLL